MRLDYDLNVRALYISLSGNDVARTRVVDDNTCVDLDAAGGVVGIEVIAFNYPWPVEAVLSDFPIPDSEAAQIRAYFRPPLPRSVSAAAPLAPQEAPALSIAPVGAAA